MMVTESVEAWVSKLTAESIPVLPQSVERLAQLRAKAEYIRPRDISQAVLHDPMLTLSVLRFLRLQRTDRMLTDITTVEHAVMMMGVDPFFEAFSDLQSIDQVLRGDAVAMNGLMAVVARARHAALHASEWARLRNDIESDEVIIAALLHDVAEMMLWCFAPRLAEQIESRLRADGSLRSADVQFDILGFRLNELELELVKSWELPPLLTSLLDDYRVDRPRARNVLLAVELGRHAAHGWENPAIVDDLRGIQRLIGGSLREVRQRVYATALGAVRDHDWYGQQAPAVWLPPYPIAVDEDVETRPGAQSSRLVLEHAQRVLESDFEDGFWGSGRTLRMGPEGKVLTHGLVTLTLHALYKGVAFSRCGYFVIDSSGQARAQYLGGSVASATLAAAPLPVSDALLELFGPQGDQPIAWWRGRDDATPALSLPEAWQSFVTSNGFLLARVTTTDAQGLIYADGRRPVTESQFSNFQVLCNLLQARLGESLARA
jgi:HD-like signal output (HDOD) protein